MRCKVKALVIDTETYLFEPGYRAPKVVCLSYASKSESGLITDSGSLRMGTGFGAQKIDEFFRVIPNYLETNNTYLVGHNISYDMCCLMATYPKLQPIIWRLYEDDRIKDTKVRYQLEALSRGKLHLEKFSLAALAEKYLHQKMDKDTWRLRYSELDGIPLDQWPEGAIKYAISDSVATYMLWLLSDFESPDEWLRVRGDFALYLDTCWGAETDQPAIEVKRKEFQEKIRKLDENLQIYGLVRANGTVNNNAVRQRIVETTENPQKTKKGNVKTDSLALIQSNDSVLLELKKRKEIKKNLTDFLPKLTPIVNPSFHSILRSGRISCYDPNLQQLPRTAGIREMFIPRPGWIFVGIDVSRAELCAIAEICYINFGFSGLGDVLRKGVDPHSLLASHLSGVNYDEFQLIRKNKNHLRYKEFNDNRHLAKIGNFGKWGGMGYRTFVKHCLKNGVVITETESLQIEQLMKTLYPEMVLFFEEVSSRGYPHIRKQLKSGRLRGGLGYTDGCNTQFQGLVADAMLETTYELQFACRGDISNILFGCKPNFPIHDEWITEVPIEKVKECAEAKAELVKRVFSRWITHVPIDVEYNIMERWHK